MSYIGRDIRTGAFRQLDDISSGFDGSDTTHTMQVNSTNVSVGDVNQILLSLGGVIQKPGTDFTVSGSTLTFTTAPAANTSFFAILLGSDNGGTVTPTDGSVTTSKIVDDAVTAAKVASSGAFAIGATGTSSSLAGIPFFSDTTNGSIYTHDVSGTDSTAARNTAYGLTTLDAITTGDDNTVMGHAAGTALQDGAENVAIGTNSMAAATSAGQNTCVGHNSGAALSSGSLYNVLLGHGAGASMTTGNRNIAIGVSSMDGFDTEAHNLGIGISALGGSVAGGEYNVAIGNYTLDALTSADSNTAVGYNAGSSMNSGGANNCFGESAGANITTGSNNTAVGQNAGNAGTVLTTGSNNVLLGGETKVSAADGGYQFVIGRNVTSNGNSTTTIGYDTTEIATNHGSASWAAVSDERYKKDIETSTAGLSFINDLRPVTFKFKQKNELDTDLYGYDANSTDTDGYTDEVAHGFIAQEIKTVIDNHPEIKAGQEIWKQAPEAKGKRQNVSHIGMIPMMVKAIQELSAKVKALEEA
jgi:hypothetical protein